ncbi:hypothetical protein KIN20_011631 [Parelaphostrongylus tenuis]|uniref:ATPase dynein-related AAA domain-containing protein n=1 Tax=Parelaphostrongylus tenuis TaxID=148309 RepID=A0AAD5MD62_PARTN|nr:hypothetical protein KIN20_011631 [Parelaphostrongylus tenuis]
MMVSTRILSTLSRRLMSGSVNAPKSTLRIGSVCVTVSDPVRPELTPARYLESDVRPTAEVVSHLKWLLQKEILGQDVFLIGVPGALRSDIVLRYLELCKREYEYLAVTRDTTEADIKQRREIRSGTAFYTDLVCSVSMFLANFLFKRFIRQSKMLRLYNQQC